jgi:hypothetical protein
MPCLGQAGELAKGYFNDAKVQLDMGIIRNGEAAVHWEPCSAAAHAGFSPDDFMASFAGDVALLVDGGVPVIGYYGDTDTMCDFIGGKHWMMAMSWSKQAEWNEAPDENWTAFGKVAGKRRSLGGLTYLRVFDSGHLVPQDQPAVALTMISEFVGASSHRETVPSLLADPAPSGGFASAFAVLSPIAVATSFVAFRTLALRRARSHHLEEKPEAASAYVQINA